MYTNMAFVTTNVLFIEVSSSKSHCKANIEYRFICHMLLLLFVFLYLYIGMISLPLEEADLYGVSVKMRISEKVEHFTVSISLPYSLLCWYRLTFKLEGSSCPHSIM